MKLDRRFRLFPLLVLSLSAAGWSSSATATQAEPAAATKEVTLADELPAFPAEVRTALLEGRTANALAAIDKILASGQGDLVPLRFLRASTLALLGRLEEAVTAFEEVEAMEADGAWTLKARFARADALRALRRNDLAEAIYESEARRLLSEGRKRELAKIYLDIADRLSKPQDLSRPDSAPPDFACAAVLYQQAIELDAPVDLRALALYRRAHALQQAQSWPDAIATLQRFIAEFDKDWNAASAASDEMRWTAQFRLGKCQHQADQKSEALRTFEDLAQRLEARSEPVARRIAGDALYAASLVRAANGEDQRAIDVLNKLVKKFPEHARVAAALFDVAERLEKIGDDETALATWNELLLRAPGADLSADDRDEHARLVRMALFRKGKLLHKQARFDEAIACFNDYVAKYPASEQWSEAQQSIVTAEYLAGTRLRDDKRFDEARQSWNRFLETHPLDARVPQILFDLGQMYVDAAIAAAAADAAVEKSPAQQERYQAAIAQWQKLIAKFPGSEIAANAQFSIGEIEETRLGDLEGAVAAYRACKNGAAAANAALRLQQMLKPQLALTTERIYRTDETSRIRIQVRNLEKVQISLYKIDLEAYFRKHLRIQGVEALDLDLITPDSSFEAAIDGFQKFRPIDQQVEIPLELTGKGPGAFAVAVRGEKLRATSLLLRSDLDIVVKSSRREILAFAENQRTQSSMSGVSVLAIAIPQDGGEPQSLSLTTGEDGVARARWDRLVDASSVMVFASKDGNCASDQLALAGLVLATGLSPRGLLYTDRTLYRPGQKVSMRGVLREVVDGSYAFKSGDPWRLEVEDSKGRSIHSAALALSEFGTLSDELELDAFAPLGSYTIRCFAVSGTTFAAAFEVQEYQLPKAEISFDLPRTVYLRGETVELTARAAWYYGEPIRNAELSCLLPDGRTQTLRTDEEGKARLSFNTREQAFEGALTFLFTLTQEGVSARTQVLLAQKAFNVSLNTLRDVYVAGERFDVTVAARAADGKPTAQKLKVRLMQRKQVERRDWLANTLSSTWAETLVREWPLETDKERGQGSVSIEVGTGGQYVLRVEGEDSFGNQVRGERAIFVSGEEDATRLRFLADRTRVQVGEEIVVGLHNRAGKGLALLTFEGEEILGYRIVTLSEGLNSVALTIGHEHFPVFAIGASAMRGDRFHEALLPLEVERALRVRVEPKSTTVAPGEELSVDLFAQDQLGRPVEAELSLAVIDEALLSMAGARGSIVAFFEAGLQRQAALRTTTSCTFRYAGVTTEIAAAVLAQADAEKAKSQWEEERLELKDKLAQAPGAPASESAPALARRRAGGGGRGGDTTHANADEAGRAAEGQVQEALQELGYSEELADSPGFYTGRGAKAGGGARGGVGRASGMPRGQFLETAFWSPSVRTDLEGHATVKFRLPDQTTRWRLQAVGVTRNTQVGESGASVTARAEFFVELRTPSLLTEGDQPKWLARVHNLTDANGTATLKLRVTSGSEVTTTPVEVEVAAGRVREVTFPTDAAVAFVDALKVEVEADATLGSRTVHDAVVHRIPVRPWGLELTDSRSGVLTADRTFWLELPKDLPCENRHVEVFVGSGVQRMLIEEALQTSPVALRASHCLLPPTHADAASSLLGVCAVLAESEASGAADKADLEALRARARSWSARLVAAQSDDGGWPWLGGASDPYSSSLAIVALGAARKLGTALPDKTLDAGYQYLQNVTRSSSQEANELKALLLYALSTAGRGDFGVANRLHRVRNQLSSAALSFTTLALVEMGKAAMAEEIAHILVERKESRPIDDSMPGWVWPSKDNDAFHRSGIETTALALLALQRALPGSTEVDAGVKYLLASRPWSPDRAAGWALTALAEWYHKTLPTRTEAKVQIRVDGKEIRTLDLSGTGLGQLVRVPLDASAPARIKVELGYRGRGEPHFVAVMKGFTSQMRELRKRDLSIEENFLAPPAQLHGRALPEGFGILHGSYKSWRNTVSQIPSGALSTVAVTYWRAVPSGTRPEQLDYLVVEVPLPAGATPLRETIRGDFDSYELRDGSAFFFLGAQRTGGTLALSLLGAIPGNFRVLPATLRSAYDPDVYVIDKSRTLEVLERGEKQTDVYRPTPDELYALGKSCFEAGERDTAFEALDKLYTEWQENLEKGAYQDVVGMLLILSIDRADAGRIVDYFEVMQEKGLDLTIPFEKILAVGEAYRKKEEFERATLVFRAAIEETFGKDLKISATLEEQKQLAQAVQFIQDLCSEFPDLPRVEETFLALSDKYSSLVPQLSHPSLKLAGWTRADLQLRAMRVLQSFLALHPDHPLAPEAALSLVSAHFELKDYETASTLAGTMARRFTAPKYADAFTYTQALALWSLGKDDPAMALLQKIAGAEYPDEHGRNTPSANRELSWYILGQIHHARRQIAQAIELYEKVQAGFPDAREAIANFRERSIRIDEVTYARPGEEVKLELSYRNVHHAEVLVYSVDLMTLYLRERNLSSVKDVNLAGITPVQRTLVELTSKEELRDEKHELPLKLDKPGAYLVMVRGDELHTSGLVLVSNLKLEVREDPVSGRMRVYVIDAATGNYVRDVDVKVIGSQNADFTSGETDPRGLFVADKVQGTATVIARQGKDQYAFYRGTTALIAPPPEAENLKQLGEVEEDQQSYFKNVRNLDTENRARRTQQLQQEIQQTRKGVQVQKIEK